MKADHESDSNDYFAAKSSKGGGRYSVRGRNNNFSPEETRLLQEIADPQREVLRARDKWIKEKAWNDLAEEFNQRTPAAEPRTLEQLKIKLKNLKFFSLNRMTLGSESKFEDENELDETDPLTAPTANALAISKAEPSWTYPGDDFDLEDAEEDGVEIVPESTIRAPMAIAKARTRTKRKAEDEHDYEPFFPESGITPVAASSNNSASNLSLFQLEREERLLRIKCLQVSYQAELDKRKHAKAEHEQKMRHMEEEHRVRMEQLKKQDQGQVHSQSHSHSNNVEGVGHQESAGPVFNGVVTAPVNGYSY